MPINPSYFDKYGNLIKDQYGNTIAPGQSQDGSQPGLSGSTPGSPAPGSSTPAPTGSPVQQFQAGLQNLPYYNTPAFQQLIGNFTSDPNRTLPNNQAVQNWTQQFQAYANSFAQQFQNLAGRQPTSDEYNTFFQRVVLPDQPWNKSVDQSTIDQQATGLISNTFSGAISDAQQQKAQSQATAAVAPGSAFDTWQQNYQKSINDVGSQLQTYQQQLFEKLRPQLLTSLQSQGLLDTGALNTAFAGAASDLTSGAQNFLAQAQGQEAQDVANKAYAITSAPTNFALQNTFSTIPNLTGSGQTALQNVFQNDANTAANNAAFNNQSSLLNQQYALGPSYLQQIGGNIAGGITGGVTQKLLS